MSQTDKRVVIANRQRQAIREVMEELGLKVAPWCKAAGISEGTLRNFLNADGGESISTNNLELLAEVAGVPPSRLLGDRTAFDMDEDLMKACSDAVLKAAAEASNKLTLPQAMAYTVKLYQHVQNYRRQGETVQPSAAIAALILKQA